MTYLQKLCLSQTLYLSKLFQDTDMQSLLGQVLPLYACNKKDGEALSSLLQNNVYSLLDSSLAVCIHQNYIGSFCPDKNAFGRKQIEADALEIKKNVYTNIERMLENSYSKTFLEVLSDHYLEKDELCITYALALYLSGGASELYLPLLRKAEAKGKIEAGIILMSVDSSVNKKSYLDKLSKNRIIILQKDIIEKIENFYLIKGGNV